MPLSKLDLFDRDELIAMLARQQKKGDEADEAASAGGGVPHGAEGKSVCSPSAVVLFGRPGIGKSAAAAALLRRSVADGIWSSGCCCHLGSASNLEVCE